MPRAFPPEFRRDVVHRWLKIADVDDGIRPGVTSSESAELREPPVSQRDWDDAHLINAAYDIHRDDPAFGYRFIADELAAQGIAASPNRVAWTPSGSSSHGSRSHSSSRVGRVRHNLARGGPVKTTKTPPLWWTDGTGQADPSHLRLRRT